MAVFRAFVCPGFSRPSFFCTEEVSGGSDTLAYLYAKEGANAEPAVGTTSLGKIASGSLIDAAFDLLASIALRPVQ
jgi:hypothetical protein